MVVVIKLGLLLSVIGVLLLCSSMDNTYYPYVNANVSEDKLERDRRNAAVLGFLSALLFVVCMYLAKKYDIWGNGFFGGFGI